MFGAARFESLILGRNPPDPALVFYRKKKMKKFGFGLALLLSLSAGPGFTGSQDLPGDGVAVRVGSRMITEFELNAAMSGQMSSGRKMSKDQALERVIETVLFASEAVEMGLDRDPAIELQLRNARETILAKAYVKKIMEEKPEISEEEILAYFRKHSSRFTRPETVRASHILFRVDSGADAEQMKQIQSLCASVKDKIDQGEDFAALARQYSQDTGTRNKGGDLGFFDRKGKIKALSDAAFRMEKGQVSPPLRTSVGYHLLKVTGKKPSYHPPLEAVKTEIRAELFRQKRMENLRLKKSQLQAKWKVIPPGLDKEE